MAHRNRCFTVLKNGGSFHGYNQMVRHFFRNDPLTQRNCGNPKRTYSDLRLAAQRHVFQQGRIGDPVFGEGLRWWIEMDDQRRNSGGPNELMRGLLFFDGLSVA